MYFLLSRGGGRVIAIGAGDHCALGSDESGEGRVRRVLEASHEIRRASRSSLILV